jgi:hypothetical protein
MDGWIKFYMDGTQYKGYDEDVYAGRASWRNSPLDNIQSVSLCCGDQAIYIKGPGRYWQADRFESLFPNGSRIVKRKIQKLIGPEDRFYCLSDDGVEFCSMPKPSAKICPIKPSDIGRWFTVEYDVQRKYWSYSLQKGPK